MKTLYVAYLSGGSLEHTLEFRSEKTSIIFLRDLGNARNWGEMAIVRLENVPDDLAEKLLNKDFNDGFEAAQAALKHTPTQDRWIDHGDVKGLSTLYQTPNFKW